MKRFAGFVLLIAMLFMHTVNSYAYVIDGKIHRTEWEKSTPVVLLNGEESNNNIEFGTVNWAIEDGSLFMFFSFIENNISDDTSMSGVSVIVEDSEEFIVTSESSPAVSDSSEYLFEGALSFDYSKGITCEIRVGAKYGLPLEISVRARFIDSEGSYSNVYDFTISNNSYIDTPYEPDEYIETPKSTTTKSTQTSETVTEKTTKSEKTTKKSSAKTTKKNDSGWFDFILNDKEENTTEINTKKSDKTTKKSSGKTKKSTVKFDTKGETQNSLNENVVTVYVNQTNTADISQSTVQKNQISTTEGSKYKLITAIFGGITLVSVAILGTIGANKKANKNKKD